MGGVPLLLFVVWRFQPHWHIYLFHILLVVVFSRITTTRCQSLQFTPSYAVEASVMQRFIERGIISLSKFSIAPYLLFKTILETLFSRALDSALRLTMYDSYSR